MLNVAPLLLRAVLASPLPVFARAGSDDTHSTAPTPVLPSFALVAAGYGFGPMRAPPRKTQPAKPPRRDRRK